ncbi:MAG: SGNH/GDSL hydrolase family protein [Planctomycetes bacterium]|nr:SGNH/GDSL hydrolase family protein [Planctomycetota bacterium]MCC7169195.1 SGNH/GDSL hydrolase family protein [Planctomycetota bacterium]
MPRVVGVLVLGMVLGLIGLDLALAVVQGAGAVGDALHVPDERTLWRNASNYRGERVSTDAFGLRSPGLPRDADKREVRILLLGDSRVFGGGEPGPLDDEALHAQLTRQLATRVRAGVRVLNGAVSGFSTVQACHHGIRYLDVVEPDLVLLFLSPGGRCLLDTSSTYENVRIDNVLVPRDLAAWAPRRFVLQIARIHQWLSEHSRMYARHRRVASDLDGGLGDVRTGFVFTGEPNPGGDVQYLLEQTFHAIEGLRVLASRKHGRVLAVAIYDAHATSESTWKQFIQLKLNRRGPKPGTRRERTIEALRARLASLGIPSWFFPEFQESAAASRKQYYADEGRDGEHLSAAGTALFAVTLTKAFDDSGVLRELAANRAAHLRR